MGMAKAKEKILKIEDDVRYMYIRYPLIFLLYSLILWVLIWEMSTKSSTSKSKSWTWWADDMYVCSVYQLTALYTLHSHWMSIPLGYVNSCGGGTLRDNSLHWQYSWKSTLLKEVGACSCMHPAVVSLNSQTKTFMLYLFRPLDLGVKVIAAHCATEVSKSWP